MALPAEAPKASAFQQGDRGQALGDWPHCAWEPGRMPASKKKKMEHLLQHSSHEGAVRAAMSHSDKAFQKLGFVF